MNERPCFGCGHRRHGPMSGWEYCSAGMEPERQRFDAMPFCGAMRGPGGACGPDARLFAPVLSQPEPERRVA